MSTNQFDHLFFPSGRAVSRVRRDAKQHAKEHGIPLSAALDAMAGRNGVAKVWDEAMRELAGAASTQLDLETYIATLTPEGLATPIGYQRTVAKFLEEAKTQAASDSIGIGDAVRKTLVKHGCIVTLQEAIEAAQYDAARVVEWKEAYTPKEQAALMGVYQPGVEYALFCDCASRKLAMREAARLRVRAQDLSAKHSTLTAAGLKEMSYDEGVAPEDLFDLATEMKQLATIDDYQRDALVMLFSITVGHKHSLLTKLTLGYIEEMSKAFPGEEAALIMQGVAQELGLYGRVSVLEAARFYTKVKQTRNFGEYSRLHSLTDLADVVIGEDSEGVNMDRLVQYAKAMPPADRKEYLGLLGYEVKVRVTTTLYTPHDRYVGLDEDAEKDGRLEEADRTAMEMLSLPEP